MKGISVYSSEGRLNTKNKRQRDFKKLLNLAPDSYKTNTTKEELCHEYVNSFINQFTAVYPKRKIPFMIAENEYGIEKFVCSTVRPTVLPIPELYDLYECASFLAGFIIYEPLDPQTEMPKQLFSPTATLDSNTGDSFDLATLLCSFLLGAGYDAYVVCGYAPRFITLRDQSNTKCPLAPQENTVNPSSPAVQQAKAATAAEDEASTYNAPDNSVKNSKFLAEQAELQRIAALDTFQLWIPDADLDEKKMIEEEKAKDAKENRKRVHCWVYINSGRREMKEPLFIEPTTGRAYSQSMCPYMGVESAWNHLNFWMNHQVDTKVSEMNFDLKHEKSWEQLFLTPLSQQNRNAQSGNGQSANQGGGRQGGNEEDDLMAGDGRDGGRDGGNGHAAAASSDDGVRYFDAPPTWVGPLALTRSKYLLKYPPNGKRSVQYYCAKVDYFSKRVNSQNMVMRITSYLNKECTIVKEIHEWYENRGDKMYKRIRYFLENRRFIEYFHPGSFGAVKKRTEYPGKSIETDFYVNGQPFRLLRREESIGSCITEHFQGRDDQLVYRQVQLTSDVKVVGSRQLTIPANKLSPELFIVRMTLQYDRNPQAAEGTDIAKRVFYVREAKAVFYYHFGKSQISGEIKTFMHTRGPSIPTMSDQALSQEIGLDENPDLLLEASNLERDIFGYIKSCFSKINEMEENRRAVESASKIDFDQNVFEKALDTAETQSNSQYGSAADKSSNAETKGADYLTAFFRNVSDPNHMTKEEALEIRQSCLDALKARLVERANIIQSKLHDENARLGKKQEHFQRSQREGDLSTEEYEKYCTEAMFRIQILEQRLAAHEESALRKFADLDLKLSNDPRLKVLRN